MGERKENVLFLKKIEEKLKKKHMKHVVKEYQGEFSQKSSHYSNRYSAVSYVPESKKTHEDKSTSVESFSTLADTAKTGKKKTKDSQNRYTGKGKTHKGTRRDRYTGKGLSRGHYTGKGKGTTHDSKKGDDDDDKLTSGRTHHGYTGKVGKKSVRKDTQRYETLSLSQKSGPEIHKTTHDSKRGDDDDGKLTSGRTILGYTGKGGKKSVRKATNVK